MGLKVRSEISRRKEHWLPKHRQLELMHFCLQYPEWKHQLSLLDGYSSGKNLGERIPSGSGYVSSPVERVVERRLELREKIMMVENAAKDAGIDLWPYLLQGVTEGEGYDRLDVPCCKDVYYDMYRHFFWLLDKARK